MIKAQRNDIIGITSRTIVFQLMNDKNTDSNQNPSCNNVLENLKRQMHVRLE